MPIDQAVLVQAQALVMKAGMGTFVPSGIAAASNGAECIVEIRID